MSVNNKQPSGSPLASPLCSAWVSVEDDLPPEGKYVLVHLTKDNWKDHEDTDGVCCKVAKLCKGISLEEREAMKRGEIPDPEESGWIAPNARWQKIKSRRSATIRAEDEHGNNKRPYKWLNFGTGDFWGQEVDYWMPIPSLPNAEVCHGANDQKGNGNECKQ